jgi:uncharacterized protein
MKMIKCPTCHQVVHFEGERLPPNFPFCSERCKLVDLGKWLGDSYRIAGKELGPNEVADGPESSYEDEKSS